MSALNVIKLQVYPRSAEVFANYKVPKEPYQNAGPDSKTHVRTPIINGD